MTRTPRIASPQDWRPIRTHWALLILALLVQLVVYYAVVRQWHASLLYTVTVCMGLSTPFVCGFSWLLGGKRLSSQWLWHNFRGFDQVLWEIEPGNLEGSIHPTTKRKDAWGSPTWRLCIPLGGWFTKPVIQYGLNGKSRDLRITHVKRDFVGGIESVTVRDVRGDRITVHPAALLRFLNRELPLGESDTGPLVPLLYQASYRASEALRHEHELSAAAIGVIWETIWDIYQTSRLDGVKSKEGRTIREKLTAYYRNLKSMPGAAVHDFRQMLPADKRSRRPERPTSVVGDEAVQKQL